MEELRNKFIKETLQDLGDEGNPSFYMKLAWDKAVRETEKKLNKTLE